MVGASKILTVSYGTFSCTLEGFDEPFNTMKAIAEYFRDLAAEDRYFGAEPPQPDAEMLHRIAEREMARRVEAKIQKNGIILRPSEEAAQTEAPALPPAPAVVAEPVAVAQPVEPAPPAVDPVSESVAAKLQRIRSAVAKARAAQTAVDPEPEPEPVPVPADFGFALDIAGPPSAEETAALSDDETDEELDEPGEETDAGTETDAERIEQKRRRAERRAARMAQEQQEAEQRAKAMQLRLAAEAQAAEAAARESAQPVEETPEPAAEPAALPEAPAAPVMEAEAEAPVAEAEAETPAQAEPPRPAIRARVIKLRRPESMIRPQEPAPETPTAIEPEPVAAQPVAEAPLDASAETSIAALMASVTAQLETAEPEAPVAAHEEPEAPTLSPEAEAELLAELAALTDNLKDVDWGIEGWDGDTATTAPEAEETEPQLTAAPETAEASFDDADFERDLDEAFGAFVPETDETEEGEAETPEPEAEAEAEAEALAVLEQPQDPVAPDQVEPAALADAEVEPEPEQITAAPAPFAPRAPIAEAPRPHHAPAPLPEGDLSRLMDKADAAMAGSENRRRISAIAHLKAAVAATVAERKVTGDAEPKDETVPYRQDLTQAVRPRRPVLPSVTESHHMAAARPEVRPAPLVLVSEQRVDRAPAEAVAKAQAVRPRRISALGLQRAEDEEDALEDDIEEPLSPEEATSFAQFAQSRAPQGLAELLEVAAAYTEQVEGRPHFSPPQILNKVSATSEGNFSREDRLRMFGTLLRQGKIAKVKRGQYAITQASRFYQARA